MILVLFPLAESSFYKLMIREANSFSTGGPLSRPEGLRFTTILGSWELKGQSLGGGGCYHSNTDVAALAPGKKCSSEPGSLDPGPSHFWLLCQRSLADSAARFSKDAKNGVRAPTRTGGLERRGRHCTNFGIAQLFLSSFFRCSFYCPAISFPQFGLVVLVGSVCFVKTECPPACSVLRTVSQSAYMDKTMWQEEFDKYKGTSTDQTYHSLSE